MEAIASDEDIKQFEHMPDLIEVMDKSGCDVRLTVRNLFSRISNLPLPQLL